MCIKVRLLLFGDQPTIFFFEKLKQAVIDIGELFTTARIDELTGLFDLIMVDASAVEDVNQVVRTLRAKYPFTKIAVFTIAPTWTQPGDILAAGADYFNTKYMSVDEIHSFIQAKLLEG